VTASVLSLAASPDGTGNSVVSLVVSEGDAPSVARLAAVDRVSLVLLAPEP
jgi:hypothetical protein